MSNKIKLLNLVLIVVFIFSFTACNTPKAVTETTTKQTETTVTENTIPETTSPLTNGLTEAQRKQAYYDLAVLQDSIAIDDPPDRSEKMAEAYLVIAKKYGITKDEMIQITAEGMDKNWPLPPLE